MYKTIEECRVELVSYSGDDFMPCSAARVSFGNEDKTGKDVAKDKKLMKYLADHEHMTPFEHQTATFLVECPLFIRSQIMRHRTFSYNEISRRYTDENLEFWVPDALRKQSQSNRQASTDEMVECHSANLEAYKNGLDASLDLYEDLVANGVCREQARAVLPQALLTKFYMTGNLRNWAHFLELRLGDGAQKEVAVIANKIHSQLESIWPQSLSVLINTEK